MEPMRSIPAEVICLVGMNADLFRPGSGRRVRPHGARSRAGDRSRVNEDRYLFLETILSARSVLSVSYIGQSIRDNAELAPAVPVSLLLDYAEGRSPPRAARCATGSSPSPAAALERPLPPGRRSRRGGGALDLLRRNVLAALALAAPRKAPRRLLSGRLRPPAEQARVVSLDELVRFFANPSGTSWSGGSASACDARARRRTTASPSCSPAWSATSSRAGCSRRSCAPAAGGRARGGLARAARRGKPPARHGGAIELERAAASVRSFWARLEARRSVPASPARSVSVPLPEGEVVGVLPPLHGEALVSFRWGKLRAVDRLQSWLTHLAAAAAGLLGASWSSVFVATDRSVETKPVPDARELLARALSLYRDGWCRPLPSSRRRRSPMPRGCGTGTRAPA